MDLLDARSRQGLALRSVVTFRPEPVRRGRRSRWSVATTVVVVTLLVASAPAAAQPAPSAAADIAAKQAEAEAIATSLEAQHDRVGVLTEDFNVARVEAQASREAAATARQELDRTETELTAVSDRLKRRLVDAYTNGGGRPPMLAMLLGGPVDEMAVRRMYIDVVADQEKVDVDGLGIAREARDRRQRESADAEQTADEHLARVEQRRKQAEKAAAAERATLARTQGELAGLVEAERLRRAEDEARQVKAELEARLAQENTARLARLAAASTTTTTGPPAPARATTTTQATPTARPTPGSSTTVTAPGPSTTVTTRTNGTPEGEKNEPATEVASSLRPPPEGAAAAIAEAKRQLGKPYEWGSPGPDSYDCSGLTSWAWRAGGKSLPHSSRMQMSITTKVPVDQIQPGDLVFYGEPIGHVGLYAGNGQMVEASQTGTPVRMASIYRRDLVGVGRVK